MKTLTEITEVICANVLAEHRIERDEENATALLQVAWEMGNGIEYETAIRSIIEEAIKADRAQRDEQVIAQKIWVIEDVRSVADNMAEDYELEVLTVEMRERITQLAVDKYLRTADLEDCVDQEWDVLNDSVRDAMHELKVIE